MNIAHGAPKKTGKYVRLECHQRVAWVMLDRPAKANAYHRPMLDELEDVLSGLGDSGEFSVAVIASASPRFFCAGADRDELAARTLQDVINLRSRRLFDQLSQVPVVTIAAVSGPAVGGGFELALACDFIVASETARFWLPETGMGLVPAAGGIRRLAQLISPAVAKDLVFTGRELSAAEALRLGLVVRLAAPGQFDREVAQLAEQVSKKDPLVLRIAKTALQESIWPFHLNGTESLGQTLLSQVNLWKS